ncbi:unnamed protein product, partial [Allacma fusca]
MLISDSKVRWNSSYNMFKRLIELRKPFEAIQRSERILSKYSLSESEWQFVRSVVNFLE